jgi:hypothetical protein
LKIIFIKIKETKMEKKEKMYMNIETGSVDDKEGWIYSYDREELEARGLTAEKAFEEDECYSLLEVVKIDDEWQEI